MTHQHVAVWLDHHQAKIFQIDRENVAKLNVESPQHHVHRHPVVTADHAHTADATHYYRDVAKVLSDAVEVLVLGPSTAKLAFIKYAHAHDHALAPKIVGVETVDHPTDKQIVAYAKTYFDKVDRMR